MLLEGKCCFIEQTGKHDMRPDLNLNLNHFVVCCRSISISSSSITNVCCAAALAQT